MGCIGVAIAVNYIGLMEKSIETTIQGLGLFKVKLYGLKSCRPFCAPACRVWGLGFEGLGLRV